MFMHLIVYICLLMIFKYLYNLQCAYITNTKRTQKYKYL
jgi:hypothetical protein